MKRGIKRELIGNEGMVILDIFGVSVYFPIAKFSPSF